jgi:hypothetical protein
MSERVANDAIEFFIERYPLAYVGWGISSRYGNQTVRVVEVATTSPLGRRFQVSTSDNALTISASYEHIGEGKIRRLTVARLERPTIRIGQRLLQPA